MNQPGLVREAVCGVAFDGCRWLATVQLSGTGAPQPSLVPFTCAAYPGPHQPTPGISSLPWAPSVYSGYHRPTVGPSVCSGHQWPILGPSDPEIPTNQPTGTCQSRFLKKLVLGIESLAFEIRISVRFSCDLLVRMESRSTIPEIRPNKLFAHIFLR